MHHRLGTLFTTGFCIAVVAVAIYMTVHITVNMTEYMTFAALGAMGHVWPDVIEKLARIFAFLGVVLPMVGGTAAGIRLLGDRDRFAAISQVTAEKLDVLHRRVTLLLSGPESALDDGRVAEPAHAADDIVAAVIENWQAVFGGRHIMVPMQRT